MWILRWMCWLSLLLSGHCGPGVMMRVSQKWLDYVRSEGTEVLRHMLLKDPLPDITGFTHMFGKVNYTISKVLIEEFDVPHTYAVPSPPTNVKFLVEDAKTKVFGQWKVKHWLVNDNGDFNLRLSGVSIAAVIRTFKDSSGRPSVLLSACHSEVKNAKVHLSGGASWLYNLFTVFLEKPIRNSVNEKLCPRVNEAVSILQRELATFHATSRLDAKHEIDYSLINPPQVEETYIDLDLKGSVHPIGLSQYDNPPDIHIDLPNGRASMIYVGLTEYFFNSLAKNYFNSGVLKISLTHEQFPHAFWLRTEGYVTIIPKIKSYYPTSQAMELILTATKAPVVTLTPHNIILEMTGSLQGMAIMPYLITNEIFSVDMTATLISDKVHLSDLNLEVSFVSESRIPASSVFI
uniref:Bactericidal permeability-increasing protein n=1 Tax=Leptobrachium leishanense TaxID=445787 RepID=A0A8C5R7F9_9ANUR